MIFNFTTFAPFLASDGFSSVEPGFVRDWLIVVACFVGLAIAIIVLAEKIKGKKPTEIGPVPFPVSILEEVPTRREFVDLKDEFHEFRDGNDKMERRILVAIKEEGKELRELVELVANKGYEGRKQLHEKSAEMRERIGKAEARIAALQN